MATATDTFSVTVTNVPPTLAVVNAQAVTEGELLSITDLGLVTDPGFENLAMATQETFNYTVSWGDGTSIDVGEVTVHTTGSPGVFTGGSFNSSHRFAADGLYTVAVTVTDDDGGSVTTSFEVNVDPLQETIREDPDVYIYASPRASPPVFPQPARVHKLTADRAPPEFLLRNADYNPSGLDFGASADDYLVLRPVMSNGQEGWSYRLPDDALKNLPEILRRLPDDHYRVYKVRGDGPDRLIRDVYVRQGVVIDYGDASEGVLDRPPQSKSPDQPEALPPGPPGSKDIPGDVNQGDTSPFTTIDEAWAGWGEAEHGSSSSIVESPDRGATSASDDAVLPGSTKSDSPPPALDSHTEEASTEEAAIGVSAALLSFRLRAGWHQQLDAAMSQFQGSPGGRHRRVGHRPGQPR